MRTWSGLTKCPRGSWTLLLLATLGAHILAVLSPSAAQSLPRETPWLVFLEQFQGKAYYAQGTKEYIWYAVNGHVRCVIRTSYRFDISFDTKFRPIVNAAGHVSGVNLYGTWRSNVKSYSIFLANPLAGRSYWEDERREAQKSCSSWNINRGDAFEIAFSGDNFSVTSNSGRRHYFVFSDTRDGFVLGGSYPIDAEALPNRFVFQAHTARQSTYSQ